MPDITRHLPQEDTVTALKDYVTCGLKLDGPQWKDEQQRCNDLLKDLQRGIDAPNGPTERETQLAKKFARDLAVQRAPILLPCMSPMGHVSVRCLLSSIREGFSLGTYADEHGIDAEPR